MDIEPPLQQSEESNIGMQQGSDQYEYGTAEEGESIKLNDIIQKLSDYERVMKIKENKTKINDERMRHKLKETEDELTSEKAARMIDREESTAKVKILETELRTVCATIKKKDTTIEELNKKNEELDRKLIHVERKLDDQKTANVKLCEKQMKLQQLNDTLKKELKETRKTVKEQKAEITQKTNHSQQQDIWLQQQDQQIQQYISYSNKLKKDLDDSEEKRHELTLRWSKLEGAQLTSNNPNIAGLSDTNRPTKIAERYSELFDDEWTDAYEDLSESSGTDEQTRINELLKLLKASYDECVQLSEPFRNTLESLTTVTLRVKGDQESHNRDEIKQDQETVITVVDKSIQTSCDYVESGALTACKIDNQEYPEISGRRNMDNEQYMANNETQERNTDESSKTEAAIENKHSLQIHNADGAVSSVDDTTLLVSQATGKTGKTNLPPGFSSNVHTGEITAEVKVEVEFTAELRKNVSDMKRMCGRKLEEEMGLSKAIAQKIALERNIDAEKQKPIIAYITKCSELCWFMMIQEPPVFIGFNDAKTGEPFNKDGYKAYTKTGKQLDYIVWPPLYLHKGGPMLSKGVAQGAN